MPSAVNIVALSGNLTKDPELRQLPSGTSICKMRLAFNERVKDRDGQWGDRANYVDLTVWGAHGENCAKYLQRGSAVFVSGRLRWQEWEAQDGTKRQGYEVVCDSVIFGSRPNEDGTGRSSEPTQRGGGGSYGVPTSQPTSRPVDDDDDIPF
jgi:single-strand DNA-binding protein